MANRRQSEMAMRAALFNPNVTSAEIRATMQSTNPRQQRAVSGQQPVSLQQSLTEQPFRQNFRASHDTYTSSMNAPPLLPSSSSSPPAQQQFISRTASLDPTEYSQRPVYPRHQQQPFTSPQLHSISESAETPAYSSDTKHNKMRRNILGGFKRVAKAVKSAATTRTEGLTKSNSISGGEYSSRSSSRAGVSPPYQGRPRPVVNHNPFAADSAFTFTQQPEVQPIYEQQQFSLYPSTSQNLVETSDEHASQRPPRHNMSLTSLDSHGQSISSNSHLHGPRQRSLTQQSRVASPLGREFPGQQRELQSADMPRANPLAVASGPSTGRSSRISSQESLHQVALSPRKAASIIHTSSESSFGAEIKQHERVVPSMARSPMLPSRTTGAQRLPAAISYDLGRMYRQPVSPSLQSASIVPQSPSSFDAINPAHTQINKMRASAYPQRERSLTLPGDGDENNGNPLPVATRLPWKTPAPYHKEYNEVILPLSRRDTSSQSGSSDMLESPSDKIGIPQFEPLMCGTIGRSAGELIHNQAVRNISVSDLHVQSPEDGQQHSESMRSPLSTASPVCSPYMSINSVVGTTRSALSEKPSDDLLTSVPLSRILYDAAEEAKETNEQSAPFPHAFGKPESDTSSEIMIDPRYMSMIESTAQESERQATSRGSEHIDIYEMLDDGPNGYVLARSQDTTGEHSGAKKGGSALVNDSGVNVGSHQKGSNGSAATIPNKQAEGDNVANSSLSIHTHGSASASQLSVAIGGEFNVGSPASPFSFSHSRYSLVNQDGSLNLASFEFDQLDGYQKRLSGAASMGALPQRNESKAGDRLARRNNSGDSSGSWFWSALNADGPPDRYSSPPTRSPPLPPRVGASASSGDSTDIASSGNRQNRLMRKMRKQSQQQQNYQNMAYSRSKTDLSQEARSNSTEQSRPSVSSSSMHDRKQSAGTVSSVATCGAAPRTSESDGSGKRHTPQPTLLYPSSQGTQLGIRRPSDNASINSHHSASTAHNTQLSLSRVLAGASGSMQTNVPDIHSSSLSGSSRRRSRLMHITHEHVPFDMVLNNTAAAMSLDKALTFVESTTPEVAGVNAGQQRHRRLHKRSASALTGNELDDIMIRTAEVCHSIQMAIKLQHSTKSGLTQWIQNVLAPALSKAASRTQPTTQVQSMDNIAQSAQTSIQEAWQPSEHSSFSVDKLHNADINSGRTMAELQTPPILSRHSGGRLTISSISESMGSGQGSASSRKSRPSTSNAAVSTEDISMAENIVGENSYEATVVTTTTTTTSSRSSAIGLVDSVKTSSG
ncbi:hypothetical protein BX070DRAFT_217912 [Coemansia spiralis]|nr:hypothetical protein BX070DRAFT_217912 [Coemansia spiralis]